MAQSKDQGAPAVREFPKINPLHIAYSYQKTLSHDFSTGKPAFVTMTLSISNMIQSNDYLINCKVEALNEWSPLSNPTDVSESNSFLWIGKTQHIIKNLKTNVRLDHSNIYMIGNQECRLEVYCP